jgi:hypothetical protein
MCVDIDCACKMCIHLGFCHMAAGAAVCCKTECLQGLHLLSFEFVPGTRACWAGKPQSVDATVALVHLCSSAAHAVTPAFTDSRASPATDSAWRESQLQLHLGACAFRASLCPLPEQALAGNWQRSRHWFAPPLHAMLHGVLTRLSAGGARLADFAASLPSAANAFLRDHQVRCHC